MHITNIGKDTSNSMAKLTYLRLPPSAMKEAVVEKSIPPVGRVLMPLLRPANFAFMRDTFNFSAHSCFDCGASGSVPVCVWCVWMRPQVCECVCV